jgi:hypothetical protein
LSEILFSLQSAQLEAVIRGERKRAISWLRAMRKCLTVAAGRKYIPRALKACWR